MKKHLPALINRAIPDNCTIREMTISEIREEFGDDIANQAAEVVKPYEELRKAPVPTLREIEFIVLNKRDNFHLDL